MDSCRPAPLAGLRGAGVYGAAAGAARAPTPLGGRALLPARQAASRNKSTFAARRPAADDQAARPSAAVALFPRRSRGLPSRTPLAFAAANAAFPPRDAGGTTPFPGDPHAQRGPARVLVHNNKRRHRSPAGRDRGRRRGGARPAAARDGQRLLHAEKAQRITQDERRRSLTTLAALPIHIDPDTAAQAFGRTPRCANAAWRGAMRPWQIRRVLEQAAGEIEVTGKSGHGGHTRPTRQEQNDEGSAACEAVGTGR